VTLLKSSLYLIYLITFCVVVLGVPAFSRVHVFSTCLMFLVLDCLAWSVYNRTFNPGALMLAGMTVIIFGLRLFYFSRFQALGSVLILMVLEFIMINFYYRISQTKEAMPDIDSVEKVRNVLKQDNIPLEVDIETIRQKLMEPAGNRFKRRIASENPGLFEFIDQHINLDDMMRMETAIERSCDMLALNSDRMSVRVFMNLWKINDIRRVNAYFLEMHQLLLPGGYFIGHAHTIDTHYKWMFKKFPRSS